MMEGLTIIEEPNLKNPRLLLALRGWPNAAEVASGTVGYLRGKLEAVKFAEISHWQFYDFPDLRPLLTVEHGTIKELRFPSNEFFYWKRTTKLRRPGVSP